MAIEFDRLSAALAARYRLERELGSGGMATVYLAQDLKHHRQVAIKVLKPELAGILGPERFLREIEIAGKLTHPHILALYDSGDAEGFLYYVMPYIEGESLRERLRREQQLPLEETVWIAEEIADGLSYAHSLGIVHRDVKPENILLSAGHALIADFGIARAIWAARGERITETGLAIGTPIYMSPEQAVGTREPDARGDIYSLGCVVYELLAGEPPFTGATPQALLARKSLEAVPSLRLLRETVPVAVEAAVAKALAKAPADRFATVEQFASALVRALTGPEPAAASKPPAGHRRALIGAGVGAAVVLGFLGLRFFQDVVNMHWIRRSTTPESPSANSVAVLYFDNLTRDTAYTYLADGLTEELISRLGQVTRLDVRSRFESRRVRDRHDAGAAELGRTLNAAHLLSGTVRPVGDQLRVTAELVRVPGGARLWTAVLNHAGSDLLTVQESIATAVVQTVIGRPLPDERAELAWRSTRDSAAYDLYLRGRFFFSRYTEPDIRLAMELYRQSLERDSTFAMAWAGIAQAWAWLADDWLPPLEAYPHAREAAQHAVALDSSVALGYLALAHTLPLGVGSPRGVVRDVAQAEQLARRAIALDYRLADAHAFLAGVLIIDGRLDEAREASRRAWELDSLSRTVFTLHAITLLHIGRPSEVLELARSVGWRDPSLTADFLELLALLYLRQCEPVLGRLRRARGVPDAGTQDLTSHWLMAMAAACVGKRDEAHLWLDSLAGLASSRYYPPTRFAEVHAALGELDEAFAWLKRAEAARDGLVMFINRPRWWLTALHADPRFAPHVQRIGLRWPAPELK